MRFLERDDAAGLEGDDGDMHVVTQVVRIDEARCRPAARRARHRERNDVLFVAEHRLRPVDAFHGLVDLADPVEGGVLLAVVAQRRIRCRGQIGVAATLEPMGLASERDRDFASITNNTPCASTSGSGRSLPAAWRHVHDVLGKRLGKARQRTRDDPRPRSRPVGQRARHDVAHDALGMTA